jgi:hypothetical protein
VAIDALGCSPLERSNVRPTFRPAVTSLRLRPVRPDRAVHNDGFDRTDSRHLHLAARVFIIFWATLLIGGVFFVATSCI